jgi:hypothetical protein
MPAIRDYQWAFETTTTDAGITIPKPNVANNDLLLVFAMGDTGTPTWTAPTGFTQLFARNNTVATVCYYRIADGTEAGTFTVGATVNETYNGVCISIRDVNTTNPFGNPAVSNDTTQASAAKYTMQQITTNVANALVLYLVANSSAGVPSLLEGPVFGLLGADGAAESMGVGWTFMPTAGLSPNNVTVSNVSAGAGVKAAIQIAPPSGGATVIPPYCAGDDCAYLDPINGTTAYNTNTALAATADTNFGTTLGGITAVDATVAAAADTGINSFHSTGQLTSTSSTNMAGAELVFAVANRPNTSGKNILAHCQVSTPVSLQRLGSVGSNRGVWFGIRSAAANYKIWQVHGKDAPGPARRPIPIVINDGADSAIASSGTLDATAVQALGFWNSGAAVGTSVLQYASAWLMDKTIVAGGNAAEPVGVPGIVDAVASGKERVSAAQQGANQMLLLQHVQFGNGGTNPIYLDLDATAIEFPSQRNALTKQVSYNSVDNKIGLEYYAGASDTIKHRNSVVSSPSPYFWRMNASSSGSASYDFSGLSIIGAGDVVLRAVTTFSGMAFTDCPAIAQNSAVIDGCSFTGCKITSAALGDMDNITDCAFASSGTGHAIEVGGSATTITFTGNTFSGYAGTNGSTGNEAIYVNIASGNVTINIAGGGSTPSIRTAGATVVVQNAVTVKVTAKDADTAAAIQSARVLLKASTGTTVTITRSGSTASVIHTAHGYSTGQKVVIGGSDQGEYNGLKTITVTGANGYDFTVSGTPATPATGTITSYRVVLDGDTNASGIVQDTGFNYTADLAVDGKVRKGSAATFYKTSPLSGTISSAGLDLTAFLVKDT